MHLFTPTTNVLLGSFESNPNKVLTGNLSFNGRHKIPASKLTENRLISMFLREHNNIGFFEELLNFLFWPSMKGEKLIFGDLILILRAILKVNQVILSFQLTLPTDRMEMG